MIKKTTTHLIGIDEVGRGPIAGPVAVGVFIFLNYEKVNAKKINFLFKNIKESKQLSENKREEWFEKICDIRDGAGKNKNLDNNSDKNLIDFAVTFQSEKVIDKKGISFSIKRCIELSLNKIVKKYKIKPEETLVLLDGGLKAPKQYINQKTIIKGDAKKKVIALASICAKVLRDRKMKDLAKRYPEYGFEIHKGYGTERHYKQIKKMGISPIHRLSFLQKTVK